MVDAWLNWLLLEVGQEFLKILDGHAPGGAAAGHAGQIGHSSPSSAMRAFMRGVM